jgi:hypothetical protein
MIAGDAIGTQGIVCDTHSDERLCSRKDASPEVALNGPEALKLATTTLREPLVRVNKSA